MPIAVGEEWRTIYEVLPRLERARVSVLQPEMGHTGVDAVPRDRRAGASPFHARVIPHASIGVGIFQAASLHAAATLPNVPYHEYQHSIFDKNLRYVDDDDALRGAGTITCPTGPDSVSSRDQNCGTSSAVKERR